MSTTPPTDYLGKTRVEATIDVDELYCDGCGPKVESADGCGVLHIFSQGKMHTRAFYKPSCIVAWAMREVNALPMMGTKLND